MRTAEEYLTHIDKEAGAISIAKRIGSRVTKLFGNKAGGMAESGVGKLSKFKNTQYNKYKTTNAYKNYGNKPLYAIGGATAFGAGTALGSPSKGQGVQINLPGSRQIRI